MGYNPSLPEEPADDLSLRSHRDLSLVGPDEQGAVGFLLQALGKRPPTKRRDVRIISFLQFREALEPNREFRYFSHTESIWHQNEKANGNREKHSFKKIRIIDVGI